MDGLWAGSNAGDPPRKFQMEPFNYDWTSSVFMSQDQVALESVCLDFLRAEFDESNQYTSAPQIYGVDDYLRQAAGTADWPDSLVYDPENDGTPLASLGIHEHWNSDSLKQYSRNLDPIDGEGIELILLDSSVLSAVDPPGEDGALHRAALLRSCPNPFSLALPRQPETLQFREPAKHPMFIDRDTLTCRLRQAWGPLG